MHVVTPWPVPWLTWRSAELTHAARVASHRGRAQIARHSPPAADGNWSTRLALLVSPPQLFRALPALLQYNRRTLHHVERARIASDFLLQGRGALWTRQTYFVSVEFYAQGSDSVHACDGCRAR